MEDDNVKINVSLNIPCTFLLVKANAFFLKKNFREKKLLSFALLAKLNIDNYIEKKKV